MNYILILILFSILISFSIFWMNSNYFISLYKYCFEINYILYIFVLKL